MAPTPRSRPPRAGSYVESEEAGSLVRVSALAADHDPSSPANQRRLNHQAAARDGARILPEFDLEEVVTARKEDVDRPVLDLALKALLEGRIKTLYVNRLDRLSRRGMAHVGQILDDLEKVSGRIVFVGEGLDTSKAGTRQILAILSEQARAEADAIAWRMEQWHAGNRRQGLWKKKRPYGYRVVDAKLQPDPAEAGVVRRIVEEFLAGASLRSIPTGLNRDGIECPNAVKHDEALSAGRRVRPLATRRWSYHTVRAVLLAPSTAALMSHKGQLVRDDNGDPILAGTGIITLTERARILAEFEHRGLTVRNAKDPKRIGKRTGGGRPPKYLLTGFVHCPRCTGAMTRHVGRRGPDPTPVYRCARNGRGHQCPGVSVSADDLEREVERRFLTKLAALDPEDPLLERIAERWLALAVPNDHAGRAILHEKLRDAEARLGDLYEARYARAEFSSAEDVARYEVIRKRLAEQRDAAREALAKLGPPPTLDLAALLDTELSSEAWPHLPLQRRRMLLGLAVNRVYVLPSRGRGWHALPAEERVRVVWVGEPDPFEGGIEFLAEPPSDAPGDRIGLTPRELEVLRLVTEGQSNPQIGNELDISGRTATQHVYRILAKLGVPSRAAAAAAAIRLGLFDDAEPLAGDGLRLTPRELEVLRLVTEGRSNPQIGYELGISSGMAHQHVSRILAKLGVRSRAAAAAAAIRLGLFDDAVDLPPEAGHLP
jgi:site-specific DNA recombinase